jgi:hypothetical protein
MHCAVRYSDRVIPKEDLYQLPHELLLLLDPNYYCAEYTTADYSPTSLTKKPAKRDPPRKAVSSTRAPAESTTFFSNERTDQVDHTLASSIPPSSPTHNTRHDGLTPERPAITEKVNTPITRSRSGIIPGPAITNFFAKKK